MCWATPSCSDSSPMVSKAPGSLSAGTRGSSLRDLVAHDLAGAECHDSTGRDRHFDAGLGVATNALALVAQDESSEAGDLHILSFRKRVTHMMQNALDDARGFGTRKAKPPVNHVGEVCARQRAVCAGVIIDPRDPEIGHELSPESTACPPPYNYTFVTE